VGVSFAREGRAGAQGCRTARAEEETAWKGLLCAERTRARVRRSGRDGLGYGIVIYIYYEFLHACYLVTILQLFS